MKKPSGPQSENLRTRAEKLLAAKGPDQEKFPLLEVQRLVHELQVHQTELDMQNQELRRAQEAIEEARYGYEALYDFAPVGYFTLSRKGKIIQVNLTGAGLLGVQRSLLIDQPLHSWLAPEFREAFRTHLQKVFETGGQQTCELKILRRDGTHLHILVESTTQPDAQEGQRQCHSVISDITERKRAEQKAAQLAAIVESSDDAIIAKTLDGIITSWNKGAEKVYGYHESEVIGQPISILVPPGREDEVPSMLAKIKLGESIEHFESVRRRKDGHSIDVSLTISPIRDMEGRIVGASTIGRDTSARKQAEEELNLKERLLDGASDSIFLHDLEGKFLYVNEAAYITRWYRKEELLRGNVTMLTTLEGAMNRDSILTELLANGELIFEADHLRRDGSTMPVEIHARVLEVEGRKVILSVARDITEHQRTSEQIKNLNAILRAIKDINEALLRAKSEPELFQHICGLMMGIPHNRFTWIGLVQPGSFEVKPVAWAGHEEGYLSVIKVTWDDSPHGRGPIGTAIKTGQPSVAGDIENDPKFSPWRQPALQRGYASCIAFPLICEGNTLGSLNVYADQKNAFRAEELSFLTQVAGDIAVGVKSLRLEQEMVAGLIKMQVMMIQTIEAIASMAGLRDPYTAGHQQRVTRLALALAQEIGLDSERTAGLRVASLIHDIGKIVVPAEILSRPGKLNDYEMNIIRIHSEAGHDILKKIDFPWPVAQIVLQHHERLNGSGYPQGLQGSDILQEAKILAVADVVEAMASHRPYRPALGIEAAIEEITKNKDLYDPEVVGACVKLLNEKGCSLFAQADATED